MDEDQLARTAIILSMIGIIALSIALAFEKPNATPQISSCQPPNGLVSINGTIVQLYSGNVTRLVIASSLETRVVLFSNVSLKKGQTVEAYGVFKEYNGKAELVADRLVLK